MTAFIEPLFPKTLRNYWATFVFIECLGFVLVSPLILVTGWGDENTLGIGVLIAVSGITPFALMLAGAHRNYLYRNAGFAKFDKQIISVSVNQDGTDILYSSLLAKCSYFTGCRSWETFPCDRITVIPMSGLRQCLLIELPVTLPDAGRDYPERPLRIAVGHTPETFLQWHEALLQCHAGHDEDKEQQLPPLSIGFGLIYNISIIIGLGIFVCSHGWFLWLEQLLQRWNVPADITLGITHTLFMPGALYYLLTLGLLPHLIFSSPYPLRESGTWTGTSLFMLFLTGYFIWIYWNTVPAKGEWNELWTVNSFIAASVVSVLFGIYGIALLYRVSCKRC